MFSCPVKGCTKELNRLQVMHYRSSHGLDPVEWVEEEHGSAILEMYSSGKGAYVISKEYEWLTPDMVYDIVDSRTHEESLSGENNPMKRSGVKKQFSGENNPSKRPAVRQKISDALKGHDVSKEARRNISKANTGNEISEEHRQAIAEAAKNRDCSYMQTESYRRKLSEANKGNEPTFPKPFEVEELSHKVRSSWEATVGKMLVEEGIEYDYECEFALSDCSYYPDFSVGPEIIEVKGWVNERAIEKSEQFMEEYPSYKYVVVGNKMPNDVYVNWQNREELLEVLT